MSNQTQYIYDAPIEIDGILYLPRYDVDRRGNPVGDPTLVPVRVPGTEASPKRNPPPRERSRSSVIPPPPRGTSDEDDDETGDPDDDE